MNLFYNTHQIILESLKIIPFNFTRKIDFKNLKNVCIMGLYVQDNMSNLYWGRCALYTEEADWQYVMIFRNSHEK